MLRDIPSGSAHNLRFIFECLFVILFVVELGIRWGSLKRCITVESF